MSHNPGQPPAERKVNVRLVASLVIAGLLVWWILINRQEVSVDFLVAQVSMSLWLALAIAAIVGALVGFLLGRRRYRAKQPV